MKITVNDKTSLLNVDKASRGILTFYRDENNQHRWHRKSRNGKVTGASSEGFRTLRGAMSNAAIEQGLDYIFGVTVLAHNAHRWDFERAVYARFGVTRVV